MSDTGRPTSTEDASELQEALWECIGQIVCDYNSGGNFPSMEANRREMGHIMAYIKKYCKQQTDAARIDERSQFKAYACDGDETEDYKRGFQDALWQVGDANKERIAQLTQDRKEGNE